MRPEAQPPHALALRVVAVAAIACAIAYVAGLAYSRHLAHMLADRGDLDPAEFDQVADQLRRAMTVRGVASLVTWLGLATGVALLALRTTVGRGALGLATLAAIVVALGRGFLLWVSLTHWRPDGDGLELLDRVGLVSGLGTGLTYLALAVGLGALERASGYRSAWSVVAVILAGALLGLSAASDLVGWLSYLDALPTFVLWIALVSALAGALAAVAWPLARAAAGTDPVDDPGAGARGLRLVAGALTGRVLIATFGALILIMAALGESLGLARVVLVAIPLASLIASIVAVIGALGARALPIPGARGALAVAVAGFATGALAEVWSLVVIGQLLQGARSGRPPDPTSLLTADLAVRIAVLIGYGALVRALETAAAHVGEIEVARVVRALYGGVIAMGAAAGMQYLVVESQLTRAGGGGVLLIVVGTAILVLAVVLRIARRTREVADLMTRPIPARATLD